MVELQTVTESSSSEGESKTNSTDGHISMSVSTIVMDRPWS